jgi:hypothetical protein
VNGAEAISVPLARAAADVSDDAANRIAPHRHDVGSVI